MEDTTELVIFGVLLILSLIGVVCGAIFSMQGLDQNNKAIKETEQTITSNGLTITSATYSNAGIMIRLDNVTNLIEQAKAQNQTMIYHTSNYGFLIANQQGSTAWYYEPEVYGLSGMLLLIFSAIGAFFSGVIFFAVLTYNPPSGPFPFSP